MDADDKRTTESQQPDQEAEQPNQEAEQPSSQLDVSPKVKRNIKDSMFTHLFSSTEYVLQLYQALHPDDREATEDMIDLVTLEPVFVGGRYNDLGFLIGERLLVLAEAQTTWSPNIIVRMFIYLAETYNNYIHKHGMDLYNPRPVEIPEPELYVLYTGKQKISKTVITLSEEFFGGKQIDIDLTIHMLTDGGQGDIINQYVVFTKVLDEQVKLYDRTRKAVEETIRICKNRGVLAKYLAEHEQEVIEMTMSIFDDEFIQKAHDDRIFKEGCDYAHKKDLEKMNAMTRKMIENGLSDDMIANITGLSVDEVNALKAGMTLTGSKA